MNELRGSLGRIYLLNKLLDVLRSLEVKINPGIGMKSENPRFHCHKQFFEGSSTRNKSATTRGGSLCYINLFSFSYLG